jgi:hypothetical protein
LVISYFHPWSSFNYGVYVSELQKNSFCEDEDYNVCLKQW